MKSSSRYSLSALLILFYVLWRVATLYPKWTNTGSEATISWDVFGYYLYLPATFIYDDLGGLGFIDDIFAQYQPAGDFHHAVQQPDGRYVMKYPIGMALMYLPFFLIAHWVASVGSFPADGFSLPYQLAISWGSICYAFLGLALLRNVLLRYFKDLTVALALATLVLATNYLNYVSFDGAMTHNYLFTLYSLVLWLTVKWHEKPTLGKAVGLGLTIGLATIARPIELMAVLIPLLWTVKDKESFQKKIQLLWKHRIQVGALALGMMAVGMIQLLYWKKYSGQFFYYSYGEYGFDWLKPHLYEGLLSARKGWLVYTPAMIFALLGFIPLYKKYRFMFWALLVYFLIDLYVVFSWEVWWYGGSLGSRAMVQAYAVLSIPLAAALSYILQQHYLKYIAFAVLFLFADLNFLQTWQAHAPNGGLDPEFMTRAYYWKIFGKTKHKKADKKFLDARRELSSLKGRAVRTVYENNFDKDTTLNRTANHQVSGEYSLWMNGDYQFTPYMEFRLADLGAERRDWFRISAKTMYVDMEWNFWNQCQVVSEFVRPDGSTYRRVGVRLQRLSNPWQWHDFFYDRRIPSKAQPEDVFRVYIWNAESPKNVFLDDLKIEFIK